MRLLSLGLCVLAVQCAAVDFVRPAEERVSLSQLVDVLESWRDADPNESVHYHSLGLAYCLAATENVGTFHGDTNIERAPFGLPYFLMRQRDGSIDWHPPNPLPEPGLRPKTSRERFIYCAERAVRNFEEAIQRAPTESRYWLSYAFSLEAIWSRAFGKDPADFPLEFQKVRVPSLRHAYSKVLELAIAEEQNGPAMLRSLAVVAAVEAAQALVRLEKARKVSPEEREALDRARATISRLGEEAERFRKYERARRWRCDG